MIRSWTMTLPCGLFGLALAVFGLVGCGGEADGRHTVYGNVTLDGAPLASGEIAFEPEAGGGATVSTGGVIADGAYSIGGENGPTPGKYRVTIHSAGGAEVALDDAPGSMPRPTKAKKDPIPEKYNEKSELTAVVKPSGSTEANFELKSK